jgi:hypothetical protein
VKLLAEMFEVAGRLALVESFAMTDGFRSERLSDVDHEEPGIVVARQVLGDLKGVASAGGIVGRMQDVPWLKHGEAPER